MARKVAMEAESRIEKILLRGQNPELLAGAQIASLGISAEHLGGDFFEIIDFHPGCFDLILGDVMGKGINAALIGAGIKQYFLKALGRGHIGELISLVDLVQYVHDKIVTHLIELESFVTVSYARFDLKNKIMRFVDCGHLPILHYHAKLNSCSFLKGENFPIGFTEEEKIIETKVEILPDDIMIFYSDGITEAETADGKMFGQDGLVDFILENKDMDLEKMIPALRDFIADFTGSNILQDDFTCIAVKIE